MCQPFVKRLLEQSNDVEKNPGPLPHRLVKPMATNFKKQQNKNKEPEKNGNTMLKVFGWKWSSVLYPTWKGREADVVILNNVVI